jgi:uncharacterized protein YjiS (DUF1127 family)
LGRLHKENYGRQQKAWFAHGEPSALLRRSKPEFQVIWSLSMSPFITHAARHRRRLHQKSWGLILLEQWRELQLRWVRHRQRAALRDLADDPYRLKDVGITRKQALDEANKPFWR